MDMEVLVVSTLCVLNSMPRPVPTGVMAVGAATLFCVATKTFGRFYTFVIIRTYWPKMAKGAVVTTAPVVTVKT